MAPRMTSRPFPPPPFAAAVLVLLLRSATVDVADAGFNPCIGSQLIEACKDATARGPPPDRCCAKMEDDIQCYCKYLRQRVTADFLRSPRGRHIFQGCFLGSEPRC